MQIRRMQIRARVDANLPLGSLRPSPGFAASLGTAFSQEVVPPPAAGSAASAAAAAAATTAAPAASPAATAAAAAAAAAAAGKPDLSLPKDTAAQWTVGITVFSTVDLAPDNAYLAYSLPLLLKNEVSGLTLHAYRQEEKDLAAGAAIAREIAAAEKAITDARREHDALLFNQVPAGRRPHGRRQGALRPLPRGWLSSRQCRRPPSKRPRKSPFPSRRAPAPARCSRRPPFRPRSTAPSRGSIS